MSVKSLQKKDTEVLLHEIMFNCFQSVEISESGGSFSAVTLFHVKSFHLANSGSCNIRNLPFNLRDK